MVVVYYHPLFKKQVKKIKDGKLKAKVKRQIQKIVEYPEIGKPMKYDRRGTREVYISPFRLSYLFEKNNDRVILLSLYHKDEQ
jgi:mRNA-degrading endonuclease RelE of RelBE toxin-antitoxin system